MYYTNQKIRIELSHALKELHTISTATNETTEKDALIESC